jgi:hypothetical protein
MSQDKGGAQGAQHDSSTTRAYNSHARGGAEQPGGTLPQTSVIYIRQGAAAELLPAQHTMPGGKPTPGRN